METDVNRWPPLLWPLFMGCSGNRQNVKKHAKTKHRELWTLNIDTHRHSKKFGRWFSIQPEKGTESGSPLPRHHFILNWFAHYCISPQFIPPFGLAFLPRPRVKSKRLMPWSPGPLQIFTWLPRQPNNLNTYSSISSDIFQWFQLLQSWQRCSLFFLRVGELMRFM